MKKNRNLIECQYYLCLRCDEQFYCSPDERRPSCPLCGRYDDESVVAVSTEQEEYEDRYFD